MKHTLSLKRALRSGLHWLAIFSWVAGLALTVSPVRVAEAATFVVDRTDDALASACTAAANDCSLRGAIIFANSFAPIADIITFDPAVISGTTTFNLTRPNPDADADSGDLDITDDLTFSPLVTQTIIINGSTMTSTERVFEVIDASVTFSSITIQGGHPNAPGGGIDLDATSTVTLINSAVTNNTSTAGGGIRNNGGILILDNTIVSSNTTSGSGGGIANESSGMVTLINNSVIMSNTSGSDGGGIFTTGALTLTDSTIGPSNATTLTTASGGGLSISGAVLVSLTDSDILTNTAADKGGGINNSGGTLTISGGAIQGNTSASTASTNGGGGLRNSGGGTATLTGVTISGNQNTGTDSRGAGILNSSGQITLSGSAVTGNTASGTGTDGGGIALAAGTTVTLTGSTTVSNNSAVDTGGGIHNNGGTLILSASSVLTNTAVTGGGIINDSGGSLTMTGGSLNGNTASGATGGGGLRNGTATTTGTVTITGGATVANNTTPAGEGGGILNSNGTVNLTSVTLGPGNSASTNGGGVSNAAATATLNITDSTITGNTATNGGGGINNSDGSVTLTNTTVTSNTATGANGGGGLRNSTGTVNITTSTFSSNSTTTNDGGGLRNVSGGTIHVITSTLNNNTAGLGAGTGDGGGIASDASSVFITSTVIYSNTADGGNGNGIYSDNPGANLRLDNVTLSANTGTGGGGGGLHNDGGSIAILANVTIKDNDQSANNGDGLRNAGTLTIRNSALVNNGTENCDNTGGTLTSQGFNLTSDTSCTPVFTNTGDITNTVIPLFGPLANNGGSTLTHALLTGSPAIDAGNNVAGCLDTAGAVFATDQRGSPRPVNGRCDIGAYEFVSADLAINKTDGQSEAVPGQPIVYTIVVTNTSSVVTVTDALVTDTFPAAQLTSISWSCTPGVGATCDTASSSGNISATVDLGPNASATFLVTATVLGSLTGGTLTNTAYITPSVGVADPNAANNSSMDVDSIVPHVDLTLSKDDGQTTDIPGTNIVYTLTIGNNGPSDVSNAPVTDTAPAALTGVTWSCSASVGSNCDTAGSSGNINTTVDVAKNGVVTFVLTGAIPSGATGTLLNTAGITVPVGTIEDAPANNADDDTTTLAPTVDLGISKTDGQFTTTTGSPINYTIVVSNTGPSTAASATVTDTFPAEALGATWTCSASGGSSCSAGSSGNINDTITLLPGGSATYSVSGTVALTATGNIVNTAYVAAAAGTTDSNTANNMVTDSTSLGATIDLSLTKDDGQTTDVPGTTLTYTIVVANSGDAPATDATVTDNLPAGLDGPGASWSCVAGPGSNCDSASGLGNINATVDIAVGGAVTFTVNATIDADATGTLTNTASVLASVLDVEPDTSDNQDTDTTALTPQADLAIAKNGSPASVAPGSTLTYTITVNNIGPSAVTSATVTDTFPTEIENVLWTCIATGGAACPAASGGGNINGTVNLPAGVGTVTFIATGALTTTAASGTLTNTAYVAAPLGVTEINAGNNSAMDTTTVVAAFQYLYLPLIRR